MEINPNKTIGNQVRRLESTKKINEVQREKEEAPKQQPAPAKEDPGYRISLSQASRKFLSEMTGGPAAGHDSVKNDLSEKEAAQVAQQASDQLALTNASISNEGIQKAVDLFT